LRNTDESAKRGERFYARSATVERIISTSEFYALAMAGARYERIFGTAFDEPQVDR
jgi:hypothetical protein